MNIYLPIEIKARELEGKTLLALAAAERGHSVVLGGKEDTLSLARRGVLKPGILHDKSLTPGPARLAYLKELRACGNVITSQDEESGLLEESYERFARKRYSHETYSMAGRIMCWGVHDARALREMYGRGDGSTVVETGSPRVDLWRQEFSSYYARCRRRLVDHVGDYVLVSSKFVKVLNSRRFWELVRLGRENKQFIDEEAEYALYKEVGWTMSLLAEYVRMIRFLSTQVKARIVVRPHPVEANNVWQVLLGQCPNVLVTREGTLGTWLRGAKVLIHNGCTSGLEAAVCGIPRIAYLPIRSEFEGKPPNAVSYQAESLDALVDSVNTVLADGRLDLGLERREEKAAILKARFANLDGPLAADRIVDEWERLSTASLEEPNDWGRVRRAALRRRLRARIGTVLSTVRPRRTGRLPSVSKHKYPAVTDAEMMTLVGDLRSSLGRFDGVHHVRLGERSFIVRPK